MGRLVSIAAAAVFTSGVLMVGYGLITPAKAWLSVRLLDHAWSRVLAGEDDVRPWPWMDSEPVARLSFVKAGAEAAREGRSSFVVLRGVSGAVLAFAPGWHEGTAEPGAVGTTLISAHRDTHFAVLEGIAHDDRFMLEDRRGHHRTFAVKAMIVTEEPTLMLAGIDDRHRLLLVTCYPLNSWQPDSRQRLVVVAEPI
ncbi:MAG: sortase domain-containing protein [Geminicoccaceae bacterium]